MDVCAARCRLSHKLGPENGEIKTNISRLTYHLTHFKDSIPSFGRKMNLFAPHHLLQGYHSEAKVLLKDFI